MRVTRLPALTGTSTSKLARSLRQRRVLDGTRTAPPASCRHRGITRTNDDAPSRHFNISCPRMRGRRRTRWVTTRYERRRPPTAVSRSRGVGCKTDAVHIGPSPGTNDEAFAAAWVDELDRACLRGDARQHKALSLRSSQPANQHAPRDELPVS